MGRGAAACSSEPDPEADAHRLRSVEQQEREAESPLQRFRRFLRWRKQHPALLSGAVRMLAGDEPVLAFERELDGTVIRAWFNTAAQPCELDVSLPTSATVLDGHGLVAGTIEAERLRLPEYGVMFVRMG